MVVGLAIGGLRCGGMDGARRCVAGRAMCIKKQRVAGEARIPVAALGVQDPEGGLPSRWPVAVVRDERLRALADDVATQADPRPTNQLEPNAGRLVDRGGEAAGESGRIQDQEQGLRAPGERGQSMESIGDPARLVRLRQSSAGQVQDEQVDRPSRQEAARDRQAFVQAGRRDDHEPFEADAAGDGLDRIETARQIEPGHDRALGLGFSHDPEGQGGAAARAVAADRHAGRGRETARSEDGIERREARVDDAVVVGSGFVPWLFTRERRDGQRPDDPRSCRTPSSPEARDSGVHITTSGRHRTPILEQTFYYDKARSAPRDHRKPPPLTLVTGST